MVSSEKVEETGDRVGYALMQELLKLDPRPDAVFCYNDLTAVGAIAAALDARLRVPEDVALIGCGNFRYADYLRVPLSSVDHGTQQLGRVTGELVMELALQPDQEPRTILLPPVLVARASTIGAGS